jgi:c-di-GMP-binding flagellar brake protein YcgR
MPLRPAYKLAMLGLVSSPDITSRLAMSGQLLVRSGMEIGRILDSMLEDRATLTAKLPAEMMFLSQLIDVEPVKGYLRLAYSHHASANHAALAQPKLTLKSNHRGSQFAFSAGTPHPGVHRGEPCIECALPSVMLAVQQRRSVGRVEIPAQAPITCDLRMGPLTFDAKVLDISLQGIGTLVSDPTIPLCAGTRLERARIRHPEHPAIEVDLEVRHVARVKLPDGQRAARIGCTIVSSPQALEELIRLFIIDLQ